MKKNNGYYDIDMVLEDTLTDNGMVDELFRLKDLKNRKLFLNCDIEQDTVFDIIKHIMQINAEDKGIPAENRLPIRLYITSNGGDVDAGYELIDAIKLSKTPIYTINLGYQYSMGFLIGIAGHKRFCMPSAKFLTHDGFSCVYNSGAKAQDQMEFQKRLEEKTKEYVLAHSKISAEEYDNKLRVEWYLFADEAKEKGFVDYIIGKDCSIDEII